MKTGEVLVLVMDVDVCRFLGGIKNEQAYGPFGFRFFSCSGAGGD